VPPLCGCTGVPQAVTLPQRAEIVVEKPAGECGDFTICKDGCVLVFPDSYPLTCA
jgi:hypothetical protein